MFRSSPTSCILTNVKEGAEFVWGEGEGDPPTLNRVQHYPIFEVSGSKTHTIEVCKIRNLKYWEFTRVQPEEAVRKQLRL